MSSRLDTIRQKLLKGYRFRLNAKIEALRSAIEALRSAIEEHSSNPQGEASAEQTIRRLAHQLHGSGGSYGLPEISDVAVLAEHARPAALLTAAQNLLHTLRLFALQSSAVTLLVVEDDIDLVRLLEAKLEASQYKILHATSVKAALEILDTRTRIDLVVLDLMLDGGQDGRDFLLARQDALAEAIPVLVLSSLTNNNAKMECLALGAHQFLEKPAHVDLVAVAINNILQHETLARQQAHTDRLTGLLNRFGLESHYDRIRLESTRLSQPFALALIDIDHFKFINDDHGHIFGDVILQHFAQTLLGGLPQHNITVRWGGEEFVVLMQESTDEEAQQALKRIQTTLRSEVIRSEAHEYTGLMFSGGCVTVNTDEPLENTIERADQLLLRAKLSGRDRLFTGESCVGHPDSHRALVVEDDPEVQELLCALLTEENFMVEPFSNGESALQAASQRSFELVILDQNLPGMDGLSVLRMLRTLHRHRTTPVVMLTCEDAVEHIEKAFESGIDDHLTKPFHKRELIARINRLLQRPSS